MSDLRIRNGLEAERRDARNALRRAEIRARPYELSGALGDVPQRLRRAVDLAEAGRWRSALEALNDDALELIRCRAGAELRSHVDAALALLATIVEASAEVLDGFDELADLGAALGGEVHRG